MHSRSTWMKCNFKRITDILYFSTLHLTYVHTRTMDIVYCRDKMSEMIPRIGQATVDEKDNRIWYNKRYLLCLSNILGPACLQVHCIVYCKERYYCKVSWWMYNASRILLLKGKWMGTSLRARPYVYSIPVYICSMRLTGRYLLSSVCWSAPAPFSLCSKKRVFGGRDSCLSSSFLLLHALRWNPSVSNIFL